jgi:phosphoribosylformimino-5-aminoimidazole carboxamide ribotide isomerase
MRLIPVLDILNGQAVHAVAGQRNSYQPLTSIWTRSCHAVDVVKALRDAYGFRELYVADLDGILHGRPNRQLIQRLANLLPGLWLDAGFRNIEAAKQWASEFGCRPVLGLETLDFGGSGESVGQASWQVLTAAGALLSLDASQGQLLVAEARWRSRSVTELVGWWHQRGWQHFLALDLASVGTGQLHWSWQLLRTARSAAPQARWYLGGGVRCVDDLHLLAADNVEAVLVASALHDGRILPDQVRSFVQV